MQNTRPKLPQQDGQLLVQAQQQAHQKWQVPPSLVLHVTHA
jgi:hypothetical protein